MNINENTIAQEQEEVKHSLKSEAYDLERRIRRLRNEIAEGEEELTVADDTEYKTLNNQLVKTTILLWRLLR